MNNDINKKKFSDQFFLMLFGNILITIGIIAIIIPVVISKNAVSFLGLVFIIVGAFRLSQSFCLRSSRGFMHELFIGIVYLLVGGWLAFFPLMKVFGLMAILSFAFFIEGGLEIWKGMRIRPESGWKWIILSGVVAVGVGVLLLMGFPGTAVWAIGVLVGIDLISSGWSFIRQATVANRT